MRYHCSCKMADRRSAEKSGKKRPAKASKTRGTSAEKTPKKSWSFDETIWLIDTMESTPIQSKMEGMVHNGTVWKEVAATMATMHIDNDTSVHRSCTEVTTRAHWTALRKGRCSIDKVRLHTKVSQALCAKNSASVIFVAGRDLHQNLSMFERNSQGKLVTLKHWFPFTRWPFCNISQSLRKSLNHCEFFCVV